MDKEKLDELKSRANRASTIAGETIRLQERLSSKEIIALLRNNKNYVISDELLGKMIDIGCEELIKRNEKLLDELLNPVTVVEYLPVPDKDSGPCPPSKEVV